MAKQINNWNTAERSVLASERNVHATDSEGRGNVKWKRAPYKAVHQRDAET